MRLLLITVLMLLGTLSHASDTIIRLATTTSTYNSGLLDAICRHLRKRMMCKFK